MRSRSARPCSSTSARKPSRSHGSTCGSPSWKKKSTFTGPSQNPMNVCGACQATSSNPPSQPPRLSAIVTRSAHSASSCPGCATTRKSTSEYASASPRASDPLSRSARTRGSRSAQRTPASTIASCLRVLMAPALAACHVHGRPSRLHARACPPGGAGGGGARVSRDAGVLAAADHGAGRCGAGRRAGHGARAAVGDVVAGRLGGGAGGVGGLAGRPAVGDELRGDGVARRRAGAGAGERRGPGPHRRHARPGRRQDRRARWRSPATGCSAGRS